MSIIRFTELRGDWYYSNQLMPRLAKRFLAGRGAVIFQGFPRQWIPIFEYLEIPWCQSSKPAKYLPIISELSETGLKKLSQRAKAEGTLRNLVECVAVLDPLLADFLYITDNSSKHPISEGDLTTPTEHKTIRLTNWQSYGRPEILEFEAHVDSFTKSKSSVVLLPCSKKRPYGHSRTHKRIWKQLEVFGIKGSDVDKVVITSLGIIPETLWTHPVVTRYDAGVPDIYRLLRLARRFFKKNEYERVYDCLTFFPYSDLLHILHLEGIIGHVTRGPISFDRHFYIRR